MLRVSKTSQHQKTILNLFDKSAAHVFTCRQLLSTNHHVRFRNYYYDWNSLSFDSISVRIFFSLFLFCCFPLSSTTEEIMKRAIIIITRGYKAKMLWICRSRYNRLRAFFFFCPKTPCIRNEMEHCNGANTLNWITKKLIALWNREKVFGQWYLKIQ